MPARWRQRFADAVARPPRRHLAGGGRPRRPGRRPSVDEYVELRRSTSAADVSYPLIEFVSGRPLPDAVYHHPLLRQIARTGNDLLSWFNDLASLERDRVDRGRAQPGAGDRGRTGVRRGRRRPNGLPSAGGHGDAALRRVATPRCRRSARRWTSAVADHPRRGRRTPCAGTIDWTLARAPATRCRHQPSASLQGRTRRAQTAGRAQGRRPSRSTRSSRAKTNSAMPTKPLAVKNARLTRDRSVGRDDRVLVDERDRGQRQPDPPEPAEADQRAEPDEQRERHHVRDRRGVQREAHAVPGRARCARRSPGRPRRPGRRRSGRSRRSTARPRAEQPGRPGAAQRAGDRRARRRPGRPPGPAPRIACGQLVNRLRVRVDDQRDHGERREHQAERVEQRRRRRGRPPARRPRRSRPSARSPRR